MFKSLIKDKKLLVLIFVAVGLRLFAFEASWVEKFYTNGFFPFISQTLRILLGWIPFSLGDILYFAVGLYIVFKIWKTIRLLIRNQFLKHLSWALLWKYVRLILWIYVIFLFFWGLNYYRQGIAKQLDLDAKQYSVRDLAAATMLVEQRLNFYADQIDSIERAKYNQNKILFDSAVVAYKNVQQQYYFLKYKHSSIKGSLYSSVGHFFGFTGYYNPFSGEAQLNTTVPVFLRPFIICHEMAHQVGYAKENEASFVSYLVCKGSSNIYFKYSVYYELFRDLISECRKTRNILLIIAINRTLHSRVRIDNRELRAYLLRTQNIIEPFISGTYDKYLKLNNQPKGTATYNEVVALVIAYVKKYGVNAL